jgi:dipeptidyl aminopeptidase/acylaminoacyl peptidase
MQTLSAKTLYKLVCVSDPRVSSKNMVSYVRTSVDEKADSYASNIFGVAGRKTVQLTRSGGSISSVAWSPKGAQLAYVHTVKVDGKPKSSIKVLNLSGGEPEELYSESGVKMSAIKWVGDNKIAFIKQVVSKSDGDAKRISKIRFRLDGEGYFHDRWSHIFVLTTGTPNKLKRVTTGDFDVAAFDADPAEGVVYFVSNLDSNAETSLVKHLYKAPLSGGEPRRLVEWSGPITSINLSHDRRRIAFLGHNMSSGLATNSKLHVASISNGDVEVLTERFDRSLENSLNTDVRIRGSDLSPLWTPDDDKVFFTYTDRWITKLGYYSFGSSDLKNVNIGEASVEGYDTRGRIIYLTAMSWDQPADLFSFDLETNTLNRLTNTAKNSFARFRHTKPERVTFRASDGAELEGWIIRSSKQPDKGTVLEIHGGPRTAYGEVLMFEFQFLAERGFNVIFCNPRGSSGYGEEFAKSVVRNYGDRDYRDIMEFTEHIVKSANLDRSKLYVTGGSYGGFMTNWIVSHTDLFRAAVTQRSISNWVSFYGTSDIGFYFTLDQVGGPPWTSLEELWNRSPLKYVERIKTPLLIHHCEQDYRCPIEQGEQLFTALRELGVDTVLVAVPEEGHELSRSGKPSRRVSRLEQIAEWFETH